MALYKRISLEEREKIYLGLAQGISLRRLAAGLGRSHSSVSRELKRNKDNSLGYLPDRAQNLQKSRIVTKKRKLDSNPELKKYVIDCLKNKYWSPEQIAGRMKLESKFYICKEAIYQYIYSANGIAENLYRLLPRKKKKRTGVFRRKPRGGIPNATPIDMRPKIINSRRQFGHWEGDLVLFGIQRNGNITTLVERKTRFAVMLFNTYKYTDVVIGNMKNFIKTANENFNMFKSITFDRGTEFAHHSKLWELSTKTFFCDPAAPYQKGGNENFNGRLRRFAPKSTYTKQLNQNKLDFIANIMNNTPRKILGFKTPLEAFLLNSNAASKTRCISN